MTPPEAVAVNSVTGGFQSVPKGPLTLPYAEGYVGIGWPVFPCKPGGKVPAVAGGFLSATSDPAKVKKWFSSGQYNIGLPTGQNFWVLDIDTEKGGAETLQALMRLNGPLPATLTARTRSGGMHIFFAPRPDIRCSANKVGLGVDVRGRGGYVVVAPSTVAPGAYEFNDWDPRFTDLVGAPELAPAPSWLISLALSDGKSDQRDGIARDLVESRQASPAQLEELKDALGSLSSDDRDLWIKVGHALRQLGNDGYQIWDEWSAKSDKYNADDQRRRWEGFSTNSVKIESIFYLALKAGWNGTGVNFDDLSMSSTGFAGETALQPLQSGLRLMTLSELMSQPPLKWRVKGVIPETGVAALAGVSGSGKSFLALDLAGSIAVGGEFMGYATKQAPVAYVVLEGAGGFRNRVAAWQEINGPMPECFYPLLGNFDLRSKTDVTELARMLLEAGFKNGVLIIDTLAQAMPGADENSSEGMGLALAGVKHLQQLVGGVVLLVHHHGKDTTKGMRGWSGLHGAMDAVIEVFRVNDQRSWKTSKSKDGADGTTHSFRLETMNVGIDEDGGTVTSCIVAAESSGTASIPTPRGKNQRLALSVLSELLDNADPGDWPAEVPTGQNAILKDDLCKEVALRLTCQLNQRRRNALTAIHGLEESGTVCSARGWIWITDDF